MLETKFPGRARGCRIYAAAHLPRDERAGATVHDRGAAAPRNENSRGSASRRAPREGANPMSARPLHFNAFIWPNGYHESAWRVVDDDVHNVLNLAYYTDIARIAERGLMDSIFLADNIAIAEYRATHLPQTQFDPISVLSALAAVTDHVGLIGTGSTTYNKPWELARRFATLDHLSGGAPAGTSSPPSPHWPQPISVNPSTPIMPTVTRVHTNSFRSLPRCGTAGKTMPSSATANGGVGGPQQAARTTLPRPVLRRGRSPAVPPLPARPSGPGLGRTIGSRRRARRAIRRDGLLRAALTRGGGCLPGDLHAQVAASGRDPEGFLVLPALMVTLGGTEAEARSRARQLEELASPEFRWQNAPYTAGLDPDAYDPDVPLPTHLWAEQSPSTRADQLFAAARAQPDAPLREVAQRVSGGAGQTHFIGTPEQLADHVIAWQDAGAVDGFTIMGSTLPYELAAFVDHVVPILQRRGRFRAEYTGSTLRDHLGLQRPSN